MANEQRDRFQSLLDATKAVIFFGTPHQGSALADKAFSLSLVYQLLAPKSARPGLIEDLRGKFNIMLAGLSSAFVERADQIPCIISFYETNKHHGQIVSIYYYYI